MDSCFFGISALALRCWQCSNIQGNCGDPFRDEWVSPSAFVDCALRGNGNGNGNGYDSQFTQRLPYGQQYGQQWRQPWAQPQPVAQAQIFGPQQRQFGQWGTPVCVKAKSISKQFTRTFLISFVKRRIRQFPSL